MSVRAILNIKGHRVINVGSATALNDVVAILSREKIGAVVVSDDGMTVVGIVSERDVIQALAQHGAELLDLRAADIMTRSVKSAKIDMYIDQVLDMMTKGRFRHMPVLENGRLAGMVSIGDAVKARLEMLESETVQLKEYIGGR